MNYTKKEDYISWSEYFMLVAEVSALRSKDPSTQVGSVVVNQLNQIVCTGYNGFPRGISDDLFPWGKESETWLENKYAYVVHAEANAIISARKNLTNCDLYVTLFPCNECAKVIVQSGIKKLFYKTDHYKDKPEFIASRKILETAKVKCIELKTDLQLNVSRK